MESFIIKGEAAFQPISTVKQYNGPVQQYWNDKISANNLINISQRKNHSGIMPFSAELIILMHMSARYGFVYSLVKH